MWYIFLTPNLYLDYDPASLECPQEDMTTDQDLSMDGASTAAVFAAKGIDVTPKKDQGIIKVLLSSFVVWDWLWALFCLMAEAL